MRSQLGNGGKEMTVVHTVAWRSTVGLADVGGATVDRGGIIEGNVKGEEEGSANGEMLWTMLALLIALAFHAY
jgi:hypothetical protein